MSLHRRVAVGLSIILGLGSTLFAQDQSNRPQTDDETVVGKRRPNFFVVFPTGVLEAAPPRSC